MPAEQQRYEVDKDYTHSWYSLTPNRLLATLGVLKGEINCDVCVIGAGFTGISAALELVQAGYSVIILDKNGVANQASGKNGGHLLRGYIHSPGDLTRKFGFEAAKMMCNVTLEGLGLVIERIAKHDIKCDLKFGHITAAIKKSHLPALQQDIKEWEKIGHTDLKLIGPKDIGGYIGSKKYIGGLFDPKGAHFHPLNYALGVAQTAQAAGCKIYDETEVLALEEGDPVHVVTEHGAVNAKFVIIGGLVELKNRKVHKLNQKAITATAHMIATQPLGDKAAKLLPKNSAVADANFVMNYFRLSHDNRLLFGGNCNYDASNKPGQDKILRQRMLEIFPELVSARIDNCWGGVLDITLNRLPSFGRIAPNIFYAHGYSGHGVILSNMAGKLMAEAVRGMAERFDVFARIRHKPFVGGNAFKRPLFVLGMAWYRLRDLL